MKLVLLSLLLLVLTTPVHAQEKTSGGRFQLIQLSNMRRDQYMLDTQTGKIWSKVCLVTHAGNCEKDAWLAESVEGQNTTMQKLLTESAAMRKFIEKDQKGPASTESGPWEKYKAAE